MIRDQSADMSAPAQVSLKQIIRAHLKVAARSINAAQHYLIIQDQLADEFCALNLQRMITAGNACDHTNPITGQRIQQVELQFRNSAGNRRRCSVPPRCGPLR